MPVWLYSDGVFGQGTNNKIVFKDVSKLKVQQIFDIVAQLCGPRWRWSTKIYRIDWAVDILGVSAWQVAQSCWISRVQTSRVYRSREGISFYPAFSRNRAVVIYDRLGKMRSKHHPDATGFSAMDKLTRVEVQLRGRGVPIRDLYQIHRYAAFDALIGVVFLDFKPISKELKPQQVLAAEGLQSMIKTVGLQNALKRFGSSHTAFLLSKYFEPATAMPDIKARMQRSIREWLEGIRRFPRLPDPVLDARIASQR